MTNPPAQNPGIARFRKQLGAETWATNLCLDSLSTVPIAARTLPAFERASQLLPHVQLARRIWLARLETRPVQMPADWFPVWTIDETRRAAAELDAAWSAFLDSLIDADLAAECRYYNSEGKGFSSAKDDVLIHVFNHSTYHRGQLARLVHECGGKRAATDYIGFNRAAL